MRIGIAFCSIILIWATTPLAIKWSGEGPGFLFGVTARMFIGTVSLLFTLIVTKQHLDWHRKALFTYLAVALQIYGAMLAVYWSSQFIPSGWIAVVFGLSPLMTAILAAIWLKERSLTLGKLLSYALGLGGLTVVFGSALQLGSTAVQGILGVLFSAFLQSASSVWVKQIKAEISALSKVTGGLLLALPLYLITWVYSDGHWPDVLSFINIASIVYLGAIATTIGFVLYFYLLTHLEATCVALITFVTPVLALVIGHQINSEPVGPNIIVGTLLILSALALHQFPYNRKIEKPKK